MRLQPAVALVNGALLGTVHETTFMGANTRVTVRVNGNTIVLADLATPDALALPLGAEVGVHWRDEKAHVLPG